MYDHSAQKEAEEALNESLGRFNDLVAHLSVGVYVFWIRADGRVDFEYVSDWWCRMNDMHQKIWQLFME